MSAQPESYASVSVSVSYAPEASVTVDRRSTSAVPRAGTVTFQGPSVPRAAETWLPVGAVGGVPDLQRGDGQRPSLPCGVRPAAQPSGLPGSAAFSPVDGSAKAGAASAAGSVPPARAAAGAVAQSTIHPVRLILTS